METAISSVGVTLEFGNGAGIFDQTYEVPAGTILGMIGPSGCGKTTTCRVALGLLTPQRGTITTLGRVPAHFTATDRERMGYIPQQFVLYPRLSVAENIEFVASLYGMPARAVRQRMAELLDFVDLKEARDRLGQHLSGGMQRRLMLAGALMHDPVLLFADEPTAGIDPVLRARFWEYFRQLRDQGRTLVITTQVVSEAIFCDYVAVMRQGRILAIDTPLNLRRMAFSGEIIHMTLADPDDMPRALATLRRWKEVVRSARPAPDAEREADLHVVVDDAREWLPEVLARLTNQRPRIVVASAAPLDVSYDEIFIKLMRQDEERQAH
ncbi:MAG: ABC transporter ATP-binding protein [Candidatus Viridilinea halotolerans]|uniref:ABC transporter ATP-binding protein n=1 Tax=Candidatus Viridilinea halotolerans TaxID=2491704 RepID=A0A426U3F6_9CHLR|nr:MAG: ABC transporter ATP-binding protein [Candidatus Viridilinea halotolerans]